MIDDMLIDVSTYDMPTWSPACFKQAGVKRAIVNVYQPTDARRRIETLRANGIEVIGLYGFVYFGNSAYYANRDTDWAIALAKEYGIRNVWIDAESDVRQIIPTEPASYPAQRIEQLRTALQKVTAAGLRAGIYTAAWWWTPNMNSSTAFKDYPLWYALYTDSGPRPTPGFGGWQSAEIHQYSSTRVLCGRGRDHNYLFVEQGVEAQEEDMTEAETIELIKNLAPGIVRAEIEKQVQEGGAGSLEAFVSAVTKRFDAIHVATDLKVIPGGKG